MQQSDRVSQQNISAMDALKKQFGICNIPTSTLTQSTPPESMEIIHPQSMNTSLPSAKLTIQINVTIPDEACKEQKTSKLSMTDEMFAKSAGIKSICSNSKLDKKDLKKLEKFIELLHEYMKKLNISNALIEEKYTELATAAIPKLTTNFKSKPFEAVAAAILLYSCREINYPITIKQIASVSESKDKVINKCIFSIKEIIPTNSEVKQFGSVEFIQVISGKLLLPDNVRLAAIEINKNIQGLNFIKSIHAVTLAACCIKFASALSEHEKSFDEIAEATSITKMTLKNMYRELFPYRFYFIKDCRLPKGPHDLKNI
jgi:transcription initiation factor TFIIIB Brf1 subunit/transcription initiation factor TFIIB